jgi:hypothetical protein
VAVATYQTGINAAITIDPRRQIRKQTEFLMEESFPAGAAACRRVLNA